MFSCKPKIEVETVTTEIEDNFPFQSHFIKSSFIVLWPIFAKKGAINGHFPAGITVMSAGKRHIEKPITE